ncbi:MAG: N-acetylmuramoyl-L-alanine amidase [Burkholderiales bacterium]
MKRALVAAAACAAAAAGFAGAAGAGAPSGIAPIAIDVGHSIASQGAISSRGVAEFEFNRALALDIDARLRADGHATLLIAAEGRTEDLVSRPRKAGTAGARLLISVHHDSARARFLEDWVHEGVARKFLDDRFRGFSLFVSRQNPAWRRALDCASAIGERLVAAGFKPSRHHADPNLGAGREYADERHGVHFFDNLAVLRHAVMPALLFEAGVIVNRDDELLLSRADTRARIADAVALAQPVCAAAR